MKTKKVGISTGTIINSRLEKNIKKKKQNLNKMNTCKKCYSFNSKNMVCNKYSFKISAIELGIKCKDFNKKKN